MNASSANEINKLNSFLFELDVIIAIVDILNFTNILLLESDVEFSNF
jgi:hypothetical protein